MTKRKNTCTLWLVISWCFLFSSPLFAQTIQYTFPDETELHEGTWLQWPHQYEYGISFRNENDATWVAMTNTLQANEKVHIIAYNATEQTRITNLLNTNGVPLTNVNFKIMQTNDVWVRDNGPIYVRNTSGNLVIQDWGFNGWGGDYNFSKDNPIPTSIANATSATVVNLNNVLTIEGGSYEMDGAGTFLATKTSILSQSNPTTPTGIYSIRNLGKTQAQVQTILTQNLGATKFIWLDGWFSTDDITDAHIDGFAKFAPGNKLVTMNQANLLYWGASLADINRFDTASNINNVVYTKIYLPLTANNVSKTNGSNLGYKGSYVNYYVANNRVLVPNYNDPNDAVANAIIAGLYPGRTVVGIDVRNLYGSGGMIHCVTQQQPAVCIPPTIGISPATIAICNGASAILTASGGVTYLWNTGATSPTINVSPNTSTIYTVTVTNNGCSAMATKLVTVNAPPIVTINGVTTLCNGLSTTLTGNGASNYQWTGGPANTNFSVAPIINTTYTVTGTNSANGCTSSATKTIVVNNCSTVLNLKLFIEGYYLGSNLMAGVLHHQNVTSNNLICDSITVELRNTSIPYNLIANTKAILNTNGSAICTFPTSILGNYYIVIQHRNALETWSANPVTFGATATNYDFTTSANKAYGNNMRLMQSGIWAFYSGDVSTDENIDLVDLSMVEMDISNFIFGYNSSDLNGDGNVDLLDAPILEMNISNFIFSSHP